MSDDTPQPDKDQNLGCATCAARGEDEHRATAQVLTSQWQLDGNGGSHFYQVAGADYPPGTSWAAADTALQKFGTPTYDGMFGAGNSPTLAEGTVVDPVTGLIPAGTVTIDRGDGWLINTTEPFNEQAGTGHVFGGTITAQNIMRPDGTIYPLITGQGDGYGPGQSLGPALDNVRTAVNGTTGPLIFQQQANKMTGANAATTSGQDAFSLATPFMTF